MIGGIHPLRVWEEAMLVCATDRLRLRRLAGWSAGASATSWILGNVSVLLFYALELPASRAGGTEPHVFGPISDYASLFQFLFLLPLPVALRRLSSSRRQGLTSVTMALGVIGALIGAIAQALLLTDVIEFEVNLPFILTALALTGVWMFLASWHGREEKVLSTRLARLGEVTGASLALVIGLVLLLVVAATLTPGAVADFGTSVQRNVALIGVTTVLVVPGPLAYFFGVPIWLIGLGRRLLTAPVGVERSERQRTPTN
jgi:hypothetical protein